MLPVFRAWEPTPEMISDLIQHCNLLDFEGNLSSEDPQSSTSPPSSSSSSPPQDEQQSLLQGSSSTSANPPSSSPASNKKSTLIKVVQPIPPQSRTFSKNIPFLYPHNEGATTESNSDAAKKKKKATVDPFDSERDVLSKVYILTTSTHGAKAHNRHHPQAQGQKQLIPKYLLKVFPDKVPFKHAATRMADSKNKNTKSDREALKPIVQGAIEHELGAMAWAHEFLNNTHTPKVLGYAYERDSDDSSRALQLYGILGFILMEFPSDGVLYQGPSEEYRVQDSQQIEMSEHLAEMLFEMRSACSARVSGFSILTDAINQDGSVSTGTKVTKPYSRFDLIVDALRRKDSEGIENEKAEENSRRLSDASVQTSSTSSSSAMSPQPRPLNQDRQVGNATIRWSDLTMISQSSSSSSSSSGSDATPLLPLKPAIKDPKRSSLSRLLAQKQIDRLSSSGEFPGAPKATSSFSSSSPSSSPTSAQPKNFQKVPKDDFLMAVAKRLVNAPPPPRDALEACKRISQGAEESQPQPQELSERPLSVGTTKIQNLAAETARRLDVERTKVGISPSTKFGAVTSRKRNDSVSSDHPITLSASEAMPISPSSATLQKNARLSQCFDADQSVYCSSSAQAIYRDGHGEINRLVVVLDDPSSPVSSSSTSSSTIGWPKEFVEPSKNKDGQPLYNSVAEYEHARLVNALVALERLDSTPESTNRFPSELLLLLPRILSLVHHQEILFAGSTLNLSSNSPHHLLLRGVRRRSQLRIPITNSAEQEAVFRTPGLFDGIESVFTHGQLAVQSSLVTDGQRRSILAVANFQKAGFLPPYDEDIRNLFVKRIYSSFWNVPTSDVPDGEEQTAERDAQGEVDKTRSRSQKHTNNLWPFKRNSKDSAMATSTSTSALVAASTVAAIALPKEELDGEDEDEDESEDDEEQQDIMPAGSISIHGKHPVPYPLLNHAIENGSSCGSRYMILVEANSRTTSIASSLSMNSFATDLSIADRRRFSDASTGSVNQEGAEVPVPVPVPAVAVAVPVEVGEKEKKNGSFSRMKKVFKAQFQSKSKKKNKASTEDGSTSDELAECMKIEELIDEPSPDDLFSMSPLGTSGTATPSAATAISSSSSSSAGGGPPQLPPLAFMAEIPCFHPSPSSLSLSLSLPRTVDSVRSNTSKGTLIPESPKVCQVGWNQFLMTYCALETRSLNTAAAENGNEGNVGPVELSAAPWSTSTMSFIKFKDSKHFHKQQQQQQHQQQGSTADTSSGESAPNLTNSRTKVLEALVSISKTLQNLVVVLEAGGIVLTPDQLLATISSRQQVWRQKEDRRLEQIETERQAVKARRLQAADQQYREQQRLIKSRQQQQQQEEEKEVKRVGSSQTQPQQHRYQQQNQQQDEISEIPPRVPPKDDPPAIPPKDQVAPTSVSTAMPVERKTHTQSRLRFRTSTFLPKRITTSTSTSTNTNTNTNNQSTSKRVSRSRFSTGAGSATTASSPNYAAYMIRSPDDDILYSAPGLQRDPFPSELPDHIIAHYSDPSSFDPNSTSPTTTTASPSTTGSSSTASAAMSTAAVYETDLHHKLGTMIAPNLPVYGIRLTCEDGSKTLAQVEAERVEREMQAFWRELEALCESESEPDSDGTPPSPSTRAAGKGKQVQGHGHIPTRIHCPPGIALLSLKELSANLNIVEHYVCEMEKRLGLQCRHSHHLQ
ncbi:hypothetical protein BGX23_008214 [Mortierella sp. AD031]|nr:hypothetical protein BGX23_008214 [Mortierella sp. AD031]